MLYKLICLLTFIFTLLYITPSVERRCNEYLSTGISYTLSQ